ncbi:hypothetical protein CRUP_035747 [Coryphaenoides rupestris]|nr:hypothetical protein CRUP_035747 [Coryphaenoides rupestris]
MRYSQKKNTPITPSDSVTAIQPVLNLGAGLSFGMLDAPVRRSVDDEEELDWVPKPRDINGLVKLQRFEKVFNSTSTRILTKKGINRGAGNGDGCPICQSVEKELLKPVRDLSCLSPALPSVQGERRQLHWRRLPHHLKSATCCSEKKYDVLSKEGLSEADARFFHDNSYQKSVCPSFNWRNRNNPSFILESTVIAVYSSAGALLLLAVNGALPVCQGPSSLPQPLRHDRKA